MAMFCILRVVVADLSIYLWRNVNNNFVYHCYVHNSVDNTVKETSASFPQSECTGCRQQACAGSKSLHRQNLQFLTGVVG